MSNTLYLKKKKKKAQSFLKYTVLSNNIKWLSVFIGLDQFIHKKNTA